MVSEEKVSRKIYHRGTEDTEKIERFVIANLSFVIGSYFEMANFKLSITNDKYLLRALCVSVVLFIGLSFRAFA